MALSIDGKVHEWGSIISRVENLSDIRYIASGKGFRFAINKNGELFSIGENSLGELGNNTNADVITFEKENTINNVLQISGGNTYSVLVKTDGTVWGTGDYSHGNREIKSKTKGNLWTQVGNDETGLNETEITVKIGESKNIAANCSYEFNLIYLSENFNETLDFESLKTDIATVDEIGNVMGERVGTTRVIATSNIGNKAYSILVKVIPRAKNNIVAPKIVAGEDFAVVLKSDGSLWSFGYNGDRKTRNRRLFDKRYSGYDKYFSNI